MGTPKKLLHRMRRGADNRFVITTYSKSSTYQLQDVLVSSGSLTWFVSGDISPIPTPQTGINPVWDLSNNTGLVRIIAVPSDNLTRVYRTWVEDTYAVDVTECPSLDRLEIIQGSVNKIDLTKNPLLTRLAITRNSLKECDLTNNPLLTTVELDYNQLTSSFNNNLPYLQNLTALVCNSNSIGNVNIGAIPGLTNVNISSNGMSGAISFPNNSALTTLRMGSNTGVTSLDVSNLVNLTILNIPWLSISSIDLTNNVNLTWLGCSLNNLSSLTISQCPNLTYLSCHTNNMSAAATDSIWIQMSDIATAGNFTGGTLSIRNNRTTASDAAYANLVARSYTITQTTS